MKIIKPSFKLTQSMPYQQTLDIIEDSARTCYQSEPKGDPEGFIRRLIKRGHCSILEHVNIGIKAKVDRGVSHEIVRHRIGVAYSQESTRYCNYADKQIEFVQPEWCTDAVLGVWDKLFQIGDTYWKRGITRLETNWLNNSWYNSHDYKDLLKNGLRPEQARSVLPNSLATTINMTLNIRAWRHFFTLRCSKKAHPDMRRIACMIREDFKGRFPVFFQDV